MIIEFRSVKSPTNREERLVQLDAEYASSEKTFCERPCCRLTDDTIRMCDCGLPYTSSRISAMIRKNRSCRCGGTFAGIDA